MLTSLKNTAAPKGLRLRGIRSDEDGAAAVEFGLLIPILIGIFFAVTELCVYNMHARRAQQAVDFAAEYLSRDNDNILTQEERWVAEDIWQIVNTSSFNRTGGDAYKNSRGHYARSFAAVEFVEDPDTCDESGNSTGGNGQAKGHDKNKANGEAKGHTKSRGGTIMGRNCEYVAELKWSFLASQGISSPKRRSCEQVLVANNAPQDETTIPEGTVGRGAIVIADFTYTHQPFFQLDFMPVSENHITAIRMSRSGLPLQHVDAPKSHMLDCGDDV
ncbi:MAG: TadE/TadG family type IV pilus assembly protein [Litorimonas sp.]